MDENIPESPKVLIRCSYHNLVDPKILAQNPDNPNKHPAKQIEIFAKIIQYTGIRRAITVSKRSRLVTKGHGLLLAALALNLPAVPVDEQDYDSEEQELADMVADNELARWATADDNKLEELLQKLNTGDLDMEVTGKDQASLEKLFASFASAPTLTFQTPSDSPLDAATLSVEAPGIPVSHVRMVQLFLNTDTLPEFDRIVSFFKKSYGKDNTTDAVMEVLRAHYNDNATKTDPADVPASQG